jgi:hypothetical protein
MVKHQDLIYVSKLAHANLKAGDIVLFKHEKYNLPAISGVNRIVSHMGVLWKHPTKGICVVDMNPDRNGPYGVKLPFEPVLCGKKLIIYRLFDCLNFYPGEIYIRSLQTPMSDDESLCFSTYLLQWATELEYVETIQEKHIFTYLSFIFGIMTRPISRLFGSMSHLSLPRTSSFCSEMIGELFSRCGITKLRGVDLHLSGPINWLYDLAERKDQYGWGPEFQIVL